MKTKVQISAVFFIIALITLSCASNQNEIMAQVSDTVIVNQPITKHNVQRYYDQYGNQIVYDSVYTYSYSYSGDGQIPEDISNMFNQLGSGLGIANQGLIMSPYGSFGNQYFNDDFFNSFFNASPFLNGPSVNNNPNGNLDNNLYNNQFNDKYFEQMMMMHQQQIENMQKMMNSIYNQQNQFNQQNQLNNQNQQKTSSKATNQNSIEI